jgi:hypothetical protein
MRQRAWDGRTESPSLLSRTVTRPARRSPGRAHRGTPPHPQPGHGRTPGARPIPLAGGVETGGDPKAPQRVTPPCPGLSLTPRPGPPAENPSGGDFGTGRGRPCCRRGGPCPGGVPDGRDARAQRQAVASAARAGAARGAVLRDPWSALPALLHHRRPHRGAVGGTGSGPCPVKPARRLRRVQLRRWSTDHQPSGCGAPRAGLPVGVVTMCRWHAAPTVVSVGAEPPARAPTSAFGAVGTNVSPTSGAASRSISGAGSPCLTPGPSRRRPRRSTCSATPRRASAGRPSVASITGRATSRSARGLTTTRTTASSSCAAAASSSERPPGGLPLGTDRG